MHRGEPVAVPSLLSVVLGLALAATSARAATPASDFGVRPLTFTTAALNAKAPEGTPRCTSPDCVRRLLDAGAFVRITGEFGSFTGKVARWEPDSLAGFTSGPDSTGPAPAAALSWTQVQRVDQRFDRAGTSAVWGAVIGAAVGVGLPLAIYALQDNTSDMAAVGVVGVGISGALVGAFIGGVIGAGSYHWQPIYVRP